MTLAIVIIFLIGLYIAILYYLGRFMSSSKVAEVESKSKQEEKKDEPAKEKPKPIATKDHYLNNQLKKALKKLQHGKAGLPLLRNSAKGINIFCQDKSIEQVVFNDGSDLGEKISMLIRQRDRANAKTAQKK